METWLLDVVIGVAIVVIVAAVVIVYERNRTRHLRDRFGPEYDRAVAELGDRRRAESELAQRESRLDTMHIRPLSDTERDLYKQEWHVAQARFVDDPDGAVRDADHLLGTIMRAKGYSAENADERTENVLAAYPLRADDYRQASAIVVNYRRGSTSTEDLRRAFVAYREVFDDMLEERYEEHKRAA